MQVHGNTANRRNAKIRVKVLEGHLLAARYLQLLLEDDRRFDVIAIAKELPCSPPQNQESADSVYVIDMGTLRTPLPACLRILRHAEPGIKVLVLSSDVPEEGLARLLLYGINGFLRYVEVDRERLRSAITEIQKGHIWLSTESLDQFAEYSSKLSRLEQDRRLTPRQADIVGLLQRRLSNKEIAAALNISERTVRFHLENIFNKLGVRDRYSVAELLALGTDIAFNPKGL
jgi:DNA-binding NarL/FixJ family response regulator